jgi:hypothetical protein
MLDGTVFSRHFGWLTPCLGKLFVRDEETPFGVVPARSPLLNPDNVIWVPYACVLEDGVHLLQRTPSRLREYVVTCNKHRRIDNSKDNVSLEEDSCKCDRRDEHNDKVEDPKQLPMSTDDLLRLNNLPVGCCAHAGCSGANGQRCDLRRVQPGHPQPSHREKRVELYSY